MHLSREFYKEVPGEECIFDVNMRITSYGWILVVIIAAIICAGLLWLCSPDPSSTRDFGLNLFTEMIGVFLTAVVIERILHTARKREERPRIAAMYTSVNRLVILHTFIWNMAYRTSVLEVLPPTLKEFYSREAFDKIWCYLDLSSQYPLLKQRSWYEEFKQHRKTLRNEGRRILALHGAHLDAQVYADVHSLTIEPEFSALEILEDLYRRAKEKALEGVVPANALAVLINPYPKRYFERMNRLIDWCDSTHQALNGQHKGLAKPFHYWPEVKQTEAKTCALAVDLAEPLLTGIRRFEETKNKLQERLNSLGLM